MTTNEYRAQLKREIRKCVIASLATTDKEKRQYLQTRKEKLQERLGKLDTIAYKKRASGFDSVDDSIYCPEQD